MAPRRTHLALVPFAEPDLWSDQRADHGTTAGAGIARYVDFARRAEAAKLDALFKADFLGFDKHHIKHDPSMLTEPLALSAALAAVTHHIGLVVTASTSFFEPYNVARQIATLHYVSGGRAGWNAVTSYNGEVNFGPAVLASPAERYDRASEFVEVVLKLWDGWEPGAISYPADGPPVADPARIHDTDHVGRHFSVQQALDVSRVTDDFPVVFQAGASRDGIGLAARFGEAIFVATPDLAHARTYYDQVKRLVVEGGRHPDSLRVLPGIRIFIGDTEEEARAAYEDTFATEGFYEERRKFVRREAPAIDLDGLELDDVIPPERIPSRETMLAAQRRVSRGLIVHGFITGTPNITVRQLLRRLHGGGHLLAIGTPEQVAEVFGDYYDLGVSHFLIRGFDPLIDAIDYGRELIPLTRKLIAERDATRGIAAE
jgi:FMN-dependent oxidoreductase (nitrilotriacetate monooxygenase family)